MGSQRVGDDWVTELNWLHYVVTKNWVIHCMYFFLGKFRVLWFKCNIPANFSSKYKQSCCEDVNMMYSMEPREPRWFSWASVFKVLVFNMHNNRFRALIYVSNFILFYFIYWSPTHARHLNEDSRTHRKDWISVHLNSGLLA